MAKGCYSIIAYPESCNIFNLVAHIHLLGGQTEYILHDRCLHPDGTPKKAHYHLLCGWEKRFPDWGDFKPIVEGHGAVALSLKQCLVEDIHKIEDYLTHKNNPEKFQYSPWYLVKSDGWDSGAYETSESKRERLRQAKKADKTEQVFNVISLIEELGISEMAELTKVIATQYHQYRDILIEKHSYFDSYLRSKRNWVALKQTLIQENIRLGKQVEDLEKEVKRLRRDAWDLHLANTELREMLVDTSIWYGDNPPYIYDF